MWFYKSILDRESNTYCLITNKTILINRMIIYKVKNLRLTACGILYSPKDDTIIMNAQLAIFKVHGTLRIWGITREDSNN